MSRVVVGVATGNARAMAHGHWRCGQLCQALVLAVHRQLICRVQTHKTIVHQYKKGSIIIQVLFYFFSIIINAASCVLVIKTKVESKYII